MFPKILHHSQKALVALSVTVMLSLLPFSILIEEVKAGDVLTYIVRSPNPTGDGNPCSDDIGGVTVDADRCFGSIQAAVDDSDGDDTIYIAAGTYHEFVTIESDRDNLHFIGDGEDSTIVDATGLNYAFKVEVNNVVFENLTVQNARDTGIRVDPPQNTSHYEFRDVTARDNYRGFVLYTTVYSLEDVIIEDCTFVGNGDRGVWFFGNHSIENLNLQVRDNHFENNGRFGLFLDSSSVFNASITDNVFTGHSESAMRLDYSVDSTVSGNLFSENPGRGLSFTNSGPGSVYGNTFSDNSVGIWLVNNNPGIDLSGIAGNPNVFEGNTSYAVQNMRTLIVDALNNVWGSSGQIAPNDDENRDGLDLINIDPTADDVSEYVRWGGAPIFTFDPPQLLTPADRSWSSVNNSVTDDDVMSWTEVSPTFPVSIEFEYDVEYCLVDDLSFTDPSCTTHTTTDTSVVVTDLFGHPSDPSFYEGPVTWRVRAQDQYGNESDWSESWRFVIDHTFPAAVLAGISDGDTVSGTIQLRIENINDEFGIHQVAVYLDGTEETNKLTSGDRYGEVCNGNGVTVSHELELYPFGGDWPGCEVIDSTYIIELDTTLLDDGEHLIQEAYIIDFAGNRLDLLEALGLTEITFYVDNSEASTDTGTSGEDDSTDTDEGAVLGVSDEAGEEEGAVLGEVLGITGDRARLYMLIGLLLIVASTTLFVSVMRHKRK